MEFKQAQNKIPLKLWMIYQELFSSLGNGRCWEKIKIERMVLECFADESIITVRVVPKKTARRGRIKKDVGKVAPTNLDL
jgi:hypothetical protein